MILMAITVMDDSNIIQAVYNFDATNSNIDTKAIDEIKDLTLEYLCIEDENIFIENYSIFAKWLKIQHTDSLGKESNILVTWSHTDV